MELENKVIAITGGSDGLGLAAAERLVEYGARVAICGRSTDRLDKAAELLEGKGGEVIAVSTDVRDAASLENFFVQIGRKWDRLDGLVNGAGYHTGGGFEGTTDAQWQEDFELKLLAKVRGSRHAIAMMGEGGGCILNTLSIWARTPSKGSMPSSVYRAAGLALTKGLANDYAHRQIRVNAILVGFVESNQWVRGAEQTNQSYDQYVKGMVDKLDIPLGRIGTAREYADLACYLLSPAAGYITGAAVPLDGGICQAI